jgi:hypothetical protein
MLSAARCPLSGPGRRPPPGGSGFPTGRLSAVSRRPSAEDQEFLPVCPAVFSCKCLPLKIFRISPEGSRFCGRFLVFSMSYGLDGGGGYSSWPVAGGQWPVSPSVENHETGEHRLPAPERTTDPLRQAQGRLPVRTEVLGRDDQRRSESDERPRPSQRRARTGTRSDQWAQVSQPMANLGHKL